MQGRGQRQGVEAPEKPEGEQGGVDVQAGGEAGADHNRENFRLMKRHGAPKKVKRPPDSGGLSNLPGLTEWIQSRIPRLPATAREYTSSSCSGGPTHAAALSGYTDRA